MVAGATIGDRTREPAPHVQDGAKLLCWTAGLDCCYACPAHKHCTLDIRTGRLRFWRMNEDSLSRRRSPECLCGQKYQARRTD
jgi:hypothetical protein